MGEPARVPRRAVVALPALLLGACSAEQALPAKSGTAAVRTPPGPTTPVAAVDWVVLENGLPGTTWRRPVEATATDAQLCGYPLDVVVSAGEPLRLALRSALGPCDVTVLRLGHYGGAGAREVHRVRGVTPSAKPEPRVDPHDHCVTAGWDPDVEVATEGWRPGAYLVVLEAGGRWRYTTFVVRSEESRGRLVLVLATATWAAYNTWGGWSLYRGPTRADPRAHRVSHDRPQDGNGAPKLLSYEAAALRLAESLGLPVAYLTSADLEDSARVAGATGIVSLGHDEYWSPQMRDVVTAARDAGTNLAFLGANACYWRARHEDAGRSVVCYKVDARLDPVTGRGRTWLWRRGDPPEPENSLTGMLYECFPAEGAFTVHEPASWLFEGTGVRRGDTFPGIVGTEVDRAYPVAGTPASLEVVAHTPVVGGPGVHTHSDLTYYRAASGAGVVAVGTMRWTWALLGPSSRLGVTAESADLVRRTTANLLRGLATPLLGDARPPRPNLAGLGASPSTSTGTGGPVGPR